MNFTINRNMKCDGVTVCKYGSCKNNTCVCDPSYTHDFSVGSVRNCSVPLTLSKLVYWVCVILFFIGAVYRTYTMYHILTAWIRARCMNLKKNSKNATHSSKYYSVEKAHSTKRRKKMKLWLHFKGWFLSVGMFIYISAFKVGRYHEPTSYVAYNLMIVCTLCLWSLVGHVVNLNYRWCWGTRQRLMGARSTAQSESCRLTKRISFMYDPKYAAISLPLSWGFGNLFHIPLGISLSTYDKDSLKYSRVYSQIVFISSCAQFYNTIILGIYALKVFKSSSNSLKGFSKCSFTSEAEKQKVFSLLNRCLLMQHYVLVYVVVWVIGTGITIYLFFRVGYFPNGYIFIYFIYFMASTEFIMGLKHSGTRIGSFKSSKERVSPSNSLDSPLICSS